MERIKKGRKVPTRDKRENCGIVTSLLDANGNNIITGNMYEIKGKKHSYMGKVFYNRYQKTYGIFMGCWYGDKTPNNPENYGKFVAIPKDNGMKNLIFPLDEWCEESNYPC